MPIRIGDSKQFCSGLIFFCLGLGIVLVGRNYQMGTATQMGPGYFPMLLGILLLALGAIAMLIGWRAGARVTIGVWPLVPLALISLAIAAFAILITTAGLLAAVGALLVLSCYARLRHHPMEIIVIFFVLGGVTYGIFVWLLQLPITLT